MRQFYIWLLASCWSVLAVAADLPNPFLPPLAPPPVQQDQIQIQGNDIESSAEAEARPKDLKTGYQVTEYSVLGTLQGGATKFVIIAAPTGQAFVLTEGQTFGKQDAYVQKIDLDSVILVVSEELVTVSVGGI